MFNIIGFIVFGLIVGVVARLIKPGRQNLSLLWTLLIGVGGTLIGGFVATAIGSGDIFELDWIGSIVAVIAAIILIGAAEGFAGSKKTD